MQRTNHYHPHPHHATTRLHLDRPSSSTHVARRLPPPPTESPAPPHQPTAQLNPPAKPNTKFLSALLQALIMTLVIFLFFVFVGVAAIVFLHICLAGGALHRRRRSRSIQPYGGRSKTRSGFSAAELKTLPRMRYGAKSGLVSKSKELCPICLDELRDGDWCRELPDCKHCFHSKCVDRWLAKAAGCPVCRTRVRLGGSGNREVVSSQGVGGGDCGQLWAVFRIASILDVVLRLMLNNEAF